MSNTNLALAEDDHATYKMQLGAPPTTDVEVRITRAGRGVTVSPTKLTFTANDWNTAQTVTVTGIDDKDADDQLVTLSHRVLGGEYFGVAVDDVAATVTDDDTRSVSIDTTTTDRSLAVAEGDTATYTITFGSRPLSDVTITVSAESPAVLLSPAKLIFTDYNWDTPQMVTVTGAPDPDADDATATLTHTATGDGYETVTIDSVTVSVTDNDTPGISVLPVAIQVAEGGSTAYPVVLDTLPEGTVTVTPSVAGNGDVTLDTTELTFDTSNWNVVQLVTVSAAVDTDMTTDTATISHQVSGYASVTVPGISVTVPHGGTVGITVSVGQLEMDEGQTRTYTVVLDSVPSGTVTVTPTVSDGSVVDLNVASLTFTTANWSTPQEVEVEALEDVDASDDAATITHVAAGGNYDAAIIPSVLVAVSDEIEAPVITAVLPGDKSFEVHWEPAVARTDITITGYRVKRLEATPREVAADQTSYLFTNLAAPNNQAFTVSIGVLTSGGQTFWSDTVSFVLGRPMAVQELEVHGTDKALHVNWEPPANHRLLTADGKRVRYFVSIVEAGNTGRPGFGFATYDTSFSGNTTVRHGGMSQAALINGTEYTVWVATELFAAESATILVSGAATKANGRPRKINLPRSDFRHGLLRDTIEHIVSNLEEQGDPAKTAWLRRTWDWLAGQEAATQRFSGLSWPDYHVIVDDDGTAYGYVLPLCSHTTVSEDPDDRTELPFCEAPNVAISLSLLCGRQTDKSTYYSCIDSSTATDMDPEELSRNDSLVETVVHELTHVYTRSIDQMAHSMGIDALPLGVLWLHSLSVDRSTWNRPRGSCASELIAAVSEMVVLGETSSVYFGEPQGCLGVSGNAVYTCMHTVFEERCGVTASSLAGEIHQWYSQTYSDDPEKLWEDIIDVTTYGDARAPDNDTATEVGLLQSFKNEFGGYCSPGIANNAMFDNETTIFNPWMQSGCTPSAPRNMTATHVNQTRIFIKWDAPASVGAARLETFEIQWKQGNQDFGFANFEPVAATETSTAINIGSSKADLTIRMRARSQTVDASDWDSISVVTCTHDGSTWTCVLDQQAASRDASQETERDNENPGPGSTSLKPPASATREHTSSGRSTEPSTG